LIEGAHHVLHLLRLYLQDAEVGHHLPLLAALRRDRRVGGRRQHGGQHEEMECFHSLISSR
jgi:hypothetical protein